MKITDARTLASSGVWGKPTRKIREFRFISAGFSSKTKQHNTRICQQTCSLTQIQNKSNISYLKPVGPSNILIPSSALLVAIFSQLAALWASQGSHLLLAFLLSVTLSCLHCLCTAVLWNRNHAWLLIVAPPVFKTAIKSTKHSRMRTMHDVTSVHMISADAQTSKPTNWRGEHKAVLGPARWVLHACPASKNDLKHRFRAARSDGPAQMPMKCISIDSSDATIWNPANIPLTDNG